MKQYGYRRMSGPDEEAQGRMFYERQKRYAFVDRYADQMDTLWPLSNFECRFGGHRMTFRS